MEENKVIIIDERDYLRSSADFGMLCKLDDLAKDLEKGYEWAIRQDLDQIRGFISALMFTGINDSKEYDTLSDITLNWRARYSSEGLKVW